MPPCVIIEFFVTLTGAGRDGTRGLFQGYLFPLTLEYIWIGSKFPQDQTFFSDIGVSSLKINLYSPEINALTALFPQPT